MNRTLALEAIANAVGSIFDVDPTTVTEEVRFANEYGADSLDLVEVVMQVEDALDLEIGDQDLSEVITVGDAIDLICSVASAAA